MKKTRASPEDVTPSSEDNGIFKGSIVTVSLHITPLRRITTRGDLLCAGFIDEKRVEVIFPGRRRYEARSLEKALDDFVRQTANDAGRRGLPAPHAINVKFPVELEGVWRVRLDEPSDDQIERIYQFMAGRWKFTDTAGRFVTAGESPITRPITRMPVF